MSNFIHIEVTVDEMSSSFTIMKVPMDYAETRIQRGRSVPYQKKTVTKFSPDISADCVGRSETGLEGWDPRGVETTDHFC
jgi:hypothetical protein